MTTPTQAEWLTQAAREQLQGCRSMAFDGTVLFTPDGQGSYGALWTRDFAYMVENAWELLDPREVRAAIGYLLRGQRADGCIPDRVQVDGLAVYSAGPAEAPLGEPPTDNTQFMVALVATYVQHTGDLELAARTLPQLRRAMAFTPRSPDGLVVIPPGQRQSPYGFTDTIAKTGKLLFSSLLYWRACLQMAGLCDALGTESTYRDQAQAIVEALDCLWDEDGGAYRAATETCRQLDIWGNAYAVAIGLVQGERRQRILHFLQDHRDAFLYRGQVRHLLRGQTWERTLIPVEPETYQNGAYWATASGWVIDALAELGPELARALALDLIEDFQTAGICECINPAGYRKLEHYVVSAVNPLPAVRRALGQQACESTNAAQA